MINLLPPQFREKIREAKKIRIAFNVGIFIIVCLIVFWLTLMIINARIESLKENQALLTQVERSKMVQLNIIKDKIAKINGLFAEINKFYEGQIYTSNLLMQMSNIFGPEVTLNNFSFDKPSKQVVISGSVKSLKGLNTLKETLNNQRNFKGVHLSIPSYAPSEDINFKADFILENEL